MKVSSSLTAHAAVAPSRQPSSTGTETRGHHAARPAANSEGPITTQQETETRAISSPPSAPSANSSQIIIHGKDVQVPAETKLDFTLAEPFEATVQPGQISKSSTRIPVQPSEAPKSKEEF